MTVFLGVLVSKTFDSSKKLTFAVMAMVFPPTAVIPVHAPVETLGSLTRSCILLT